MMRQAVIPAPVVVGWQGGEYGSFEDTTQVSRYNAYARAEVWFEREVGCATLLRRPCQGSAISLGVESISAYQSGFLTDTGYSKMRFRDTHWLNTLRQKAAIDLARDR